VFCSGSGQDPEQNKPLLLPGIEPKLFGCQAGSPVAKASMVFRLYGVPAVWCSGCMVFRLYGVPAVWCSGSRRKLYFIVLLLFFCIFFVTQFMTASSQILAYSPLLTIREFKQTFANEIAHVNNSQLLNLRRRN